MEDIEQNNQEPNIAELVSSIESDYPIEVVSDPNSPRITEVAALDAELFGPHKSLSAEDFKGIIEKGGILFGHIGPDNALISEASLVMYEDAAGDSTLERSLPDWLGYCDGAAVSKNYRGRGLQKQLLKARELVAKANGKEAVGASVRQRNVASIKSMLDSGFMVIADAPGYYGEGAENDRVVLLKDFEFGNPLEELEADHPLLASDEKGISTPAEVNSKINNKDTVVSLPVLQSDEVDPEYNAAVSALLRGGYAGVSCHDIDVGDSEGDATDSMVFVRIDSLPQQLAEKLSARHAELQSILDKQA